MGCDVLREVKHRLLPMGGPRFRACGETDGLMHPTVKVDVKRGDERLDVVIARRRELEGCREGCVLLLHRAYVDPLDDARVGADLVGVNNINEGLGKGLLLDASHAESIDIIPELDLVSLVLCVLNANQAQGCLVRVDEAVWGQPFVPGIEDSVQHGLIKEKVAHPLGNDDVDLVHWQCHFLDFTLDDCDLVSKAVLSNDLLSGLGNGTALDAVDVFRPGLCRKEAEDASPTADVEDNLVLEEMGVVENGRLVGLCPDLVLKHLLMDAKVSIGVKVVVIGRHFVRWSGLGLGPLGGLHVAAHLLGLCFDSFAVRRHFGSEIYARECRSKCRRTCALGAQALFDLVLGSSGSREGVLQVGADYAS